MLNVQKFICTSLCANHIHVHVCYEATVPCIYYLSRDHLLYYNSNLILVFIIRFAST